VSLWGLECVYFRCMMDMMGYKQQWIWINRFESVDLDLLLILMYWSKSADPNLLIQIYWSKSTDPTLLINSTDPNVLFKIHWSQSVFPNLSIQIYLSKSSTDPHLLILIYWSKSTDPKLLMEIYWSKSMDPNALIQMYWSTSSDPTRSYLLLPGGEPGDPMFKEIDFTAAPRTYLLLTTGPIAQEICRSYKAGRWVHAA